MGTRAPEAAKLEGLALLDALRPPPGWKTASAIGTTYSLELPVAVACLLSLSGTARETADYTLHGALRALQTLGDRVRIVAQEGCVARPSAAKHQILHLLDGIVHTVRYREAGRSFHPKVWVVRFCDPTKAERDRWRLVLGSRNLTSAAAWDLGICLDGSSDVEGEELSQVLPFLRIVARQADLQPFIDEQRFELLRDVRWELPPHVRSMQFGFHGDRPQAWDETALFHIAAESPRRVLGISPFLDAAALTVFERRSRVENPFDDNARRLVAGFMDLDALTQTKSGHAALIAMSKREAGADVRAVSSTNPDAATVPDDAPNEVDDDDDEREGDIGLHAKALAVWHARDDVSVLFGSPNLTTRGWCGKNVEAWICLRGRGALAEPLWAWSGSFTSFDPPPDVVDREPTTSEVLEDALDEVRDQLCRADLDLADIDSIRSILTSTYAPPHDVLGCTIDISVSRLSARDAPSRWEAGAKRVELPPCSGGERTRFIVVRVDASTSGETKRLAWTQRVRLTPELDAAARDAQTLQGVLGADGFLAYLRGLLDPGRDDADAGEPGENDGSGRSRRGAGAASSPELSLEVLLRELARRGPKGAVDTFETLRRAIEGYRSVAKSTPGELTELWVVWDALAASVRREEPQP